MIPQNAVQAVRGRPRDAEKDATIRDAAWRILATRGYEGLTFEALAEMAQCSRATLYRRFASKEDLIATIMGETARSIEPALTDRMSPRDALVAHASTACLYLTGDRGAAIISLGASARQMPHLKEEADRAAEVERRYYHREFRRLAPDASPEDVAFVTHTLIGGIVYHVAILQHPLPPARIEQLVDQAIGLLTGGRDPVVDFSV